MINSELTIRKHTLQNPYTHQDNIQYGRLVGLTVSFNKLIQENNMEKLDQLEKIGADYLNNKEIK